MLFPSLLAFLIPLAIYCWVLAAINRRSKPTVVSGLWDCVGMLLAAGGILLMLGPVLLWHLIHRIMGAVPLEQEAEEAFDRVMGEWWFFWAVYYTLIVATIVILLWWRRTKTVIYNVDPERFGFVLRNSLDRLGLESRSVANRLIIRAVSPPADLTVPDGRLAGAAPRAAKAANPAPLLTLVGRAEVAVEVFPPMCNVALHWLRDEGNLRGEIENHLVQDLEEARTFDNPSANWFMGLTGLLFGLIFLTGVIRLLTAYFGRR